MNVNVSDASANFGKLLKHIQENGRDVMVYEDRKVVAVIRPASEADALQGIEHESFLDDSVIAGSISPAQEVYTTWGETLRGL